MYRLALLGLILWSFGQSCGDAYPVQAVDFRRCENATDKNVIGMPYYVTSLNCCQPLPKREVNFSFDLYPPPPPGQEHVRVAAHHATPSQIAQYERAYELLRALPKDDPRSWFGQANMHCAMCNGAYKQEGVNASGKVGMQIHYSWLFLPWHRWYLYFHERILSKLLGDPTFSLVFWNWDDQSGEGGNVMPSMFLKNGSSLYDAYRDHDHLPPNLIHLLPGSNLTNTTDIVNQNLNVVYKNMVPKTTPELFLGGACRVGTDLADSSPVSAPAGGALEMTPHGAVHNWTGDGDQPLVEDMGTFSTAARDPIFFTHHANLDRLWEVWTKIPGGDRGAFNDTDFLDAEFAFYDEDATLVKVKIRDALDNEKLGVRYEQVWTDSLWLNYEPVAETNTSAVAYALSHGAQEVVDAASSNSTGYSLGSRFVAVVKRTPGLNYSECVEALVLQGIQVMRTRFVQLTVFVNLPDADRNTVAIGAEYVGSYNIVPTGGHKHIFVNAKFEIGDNLERIGLTDEESVVITILVTPGDVDVTIRGMQIVPQA